MTRAGRPDPAARLPAEDILFVEIVEFVVEFIVLWIKFVVIIQVGELVIRTV